MMTLMVLGPCMALFRRQVLKVGVRLAFNNLLSDGTLWLGSVWLFVARLTARAFLCIFLTCIVTIIEWKTAWSLDKGWAGWMIDMTRSE